MILASGDAGIIVLVEHFHRILNGKGMQEDWAISDAIPIFKWKGDIMNCGTHRGVKLLEHAMTIVEKVVEKRLIKIVTIDEIYINKKVLGGGKCFFLSCIVITHSLFISVMIFHHAQCFKSVCFSLFHVHTIFYTKGLCALWRNST